jgi:hypothetical protein
MVDGGNGIYRYRDLVPLRVASACREEAGLVRSHIRHYSTTIVLVIPMKTEYAYLVLVQVGINIDKWTFLFYKTELQLAVMFYTPVKDFGVYCNAPNPSVCLSVSNLLYLLNR